MILGKSTHPVEIKQIPLLVWSMRSEIDTALNNCLNEDGTLNEQKVEQVKRFYDKISYPNKAPVQKIDEKKDESIEEESKQKITDENTLIPGCYRPAAENIFSAKSLLSDMHMESIIFFSEKEFTPGQTITLEIITSEPFCLYLKVENVMNFARDSKIIATKKMGFRILGRVLFPFEEQKKTLRNFLTRIEPSIVTNERNAKNNPEEKTTTPDVTTPEDIKTPKEDIETSES